MPRIKRKPLLVTLDTETAGLEGDIKRIAIYDGTVIQYGYTFEDIEPFLEQHYKDGFMPHVYIHNADFDLRKMEGVFRLGNVTWSRTKIIGNKYARVQCKKYIIHDSLKILPMSLANASRDFDLKHGKIDLWQEVQKVYPNQYKDKEDFFIRCNVDDPLYIKYLGYDVLALYELLEKLMEVSKIPLDNFVKLLSTASMSKYLYKNGFGEIRFAEDEKTDYDYLTACKSWSSEKQAKNCEISWLDIENYMRFGFYGGRTEVFTPKCFPDKNKIVAWHYDVNSLYPSVMSINRNLSGVSVGLHFPVGYPDFEDDPIISKNTFENWCENQIGLGFVCAEVFIPKQYIPPLPVKMEKLAFVTGNVSGCWTFTELFYAIKNCGVKIKKYYYTIYFKNSFPVFERFVKCFYKLKEEGKKTGNKALTALAKLILNTAYGWTVLRRDDKTCFRDIKDLDKYKDTEKYISCSYELGNVEIWDTVISDTIQVQIGAHVTSYARLILLDALRTMSAKGTVYYCDTDSIVCAEQMPHDMVDRYAIGKWDLEKKLLYGLFLQPKVYTELERGGELNKKFKGVSKSRQNEINHLFYDDLYNLMKAGEKSRYRVETGAKRLPSLVVAQKNGKNANEVTTINKDIIIGAKQKRIFDYEKNETEPYFFARIEDFENFSFASFVNPPNGKNIFGG